MQGHTQSTVAGGRSGRPVVPAAGLSGRAPRVSIGLPVYNGERYIEEALRSILAQTYADFELIVVDNASTDRTRHICLSYAARDRRVRYYRNPENLGVARNYNRALQLARGAYFRWAAYDDLLAPGNLIRCVEILDGRPDVVLCYPRTINIDGSGAALGEYRDDFSFAQPRAHVRFRHLMQRSVDYDCNALYGLIRTDVLRKTGMMGDFHSADRVLLAELVLRGGFHEVPEFLFYHRFHDSISTSREKTAAEWAAWFNPARPARRAFPRFRRALEFVRAVRRTGIPAGERYACYVSVAQFYLSADKWRRLLRRARIPISMKGHHV